MILKESAIETRIIFLTKEMQFWGDHLLRKGVIPPANSRWQHLHSLYCGHRGREQMIHQVRDFPTFTYQKRYLCVSTFSDCTLSILG